MFRIARNCVEKELAGFPQYPWILGMGESMQVAIYRIKVYCNICT